MSNTLGFGLDINRGGAGYKFQSETVTLLRALTGAYSTPRKIEIDKMIKSLKAAGVWGKLDVFQMYAALNAADAVINWKNPGIFNATLVNSPTLEVDRGITGNGSSSYINSGFNVSAGTQFTQNSNSFANYSRTQSASAGVGVGCTSNWMQLSDGTSLFARISRTTSTSVANTESLGLFIATRISSTAVRVYKNTTELLVNDSYASAALPDFNMFVGCYNASGSAASFTTRQNALFFAGAGLTAGETISLFTALETYLDYIGAGVIA